MKKIIIILITLLFGCSSTHKMVMPTGCKPPKKEVYHMINPHFDKHDKKFMVTKKKYRTDYNKEK